MAVIVGEIVDPSKCLHNIFVNRYVNLQWRRYLINSLILLTCGI